MPTRIGLFGGTFDPVHVGHVAIAKAFISSGFIDELWVLLTPYPPHKKSKKRVEYKLRLEMLNAALSGINNLQIKTIENELPKPSYSVQTIRHLKKEYAENKFYFCMGEDSLSQFSSWKFYEEILDECELLVAKRPGVDYSNVEKEILDRTHFVEHNPIAVSSTLIRNKLKSGESINQEVPEKVRAIIELEDLY